MLIVFKSQTFNNVRYEFCVHAQTLFIIILFKIYQTNWFGFFPTPNEYSSFLTGKISLFLYALPFAIHQAFHRWLFPFSFVIFSCVVFRRCALFLLYKIHWSQLQSSKQCNQNLKLTKNINLNMYINIHNKH